MKVTYRGSGCARRQPQTRLGDYQRAPAGDSGGPLASQSSAVISLKGIHFGGLAFTANSWG